ncbi:MAG: hypothetical protein KQJ78_05685 [Deltaproteobacteria bacterium]|nr:hypothetical protein [Deltaproteobacteria bacterium]
MTAKRQTAATPEAPARPAPAVDPDRLTPRQDAVLKASKEIAVKFIETGRLTVASFGETFRQIYKGVKEAVEEEG